MSDSRYLVTGASGFVGGFLCRRLVALGVPVRGVFRSTPSAPLAEIEQCLIGTINGQTDWASALQGIDVVIHLAARVHVMRESADDVLNEFRRVNVVATERLARSAAASGVKRLVYVSSIKVNGEATHDEKKFTAADTPTPQDPYGISKWEAEQALHRVAQETGLEIVNVRPPLVYGPGVKGNFLRLLQLISRGFPLPLASVSNLRSMIYLGNFVDALALCADHPAAQGKTYLLCDGEDISTPHLIRNIARLMEKPCRLWPSSPTLLKLAGYITGKSDEVERLVGSLQIDSSPIRRELGWTPPYTLDQGLADTVSWYLAARRA